MFPGTPFGQLTNHCSLALNGASTIYFFAGDFNPNPLTWTFEPTLMGVHHVFASPITDDTRAAGQGAGCDNCTQQAESGTIIADFVPLIPLLLKYVQPGYTLSAEPRQGAPAGVALGSLEPDDVIPFLRRNLQCALPMYVLLLLLLFP